MIKKIDGINNHVNIENVLINKDGHNELTVVAVVAYLLDLLEDYTTVNGPILVNNKTSVVDITAVKNAHQQQASNRTVQAGNKEPTNKNIGLAIIEPDRVIKIHRYETKVKLGNEPHSEVLRAKNNLVKSFLVSTNPITANNAEIIDTSFERDKNITEKAFTN